MDRTIYLLFQLLLSIIYGWNCTLSFIVFKDDNLSFQSKQCYYNDERDCKNQLNK